MDMIQILAIAASLLLFGFVVDFVRRNLLKEKYSVLWLALSIVVIILSLWRGLLDWLAAFLGVAYPPSLLFLVALIFVILICLHFSVVISILYDKYKILNQEVTLLKSELEELKAERDGRDKPGGKG